MKPMKFNLRQPVLIGLASLFMLSLVAVLLSAAEAGAGDSPRKIERPEDLTIPTILEHINRVGPYDQPDLPLKTNQNYAHSSADVEPYGGVITLKGELLKDQLKPLWFSPRDGGMRNARALRERVYRTPTADDWVLLFRTPCNCSFRDFDNEFEN